MSSEHVGFQVGSDRTEIVAGSTDTELECLIDVQPSPELGAQASTRASTSICLVLDCSGSMAGDRIEAVVEAAKLIVDSSHAGNTLSLVAFESQGHVLLSEVPATERGKVKMRRKIETLPSLVRGSTNMADGVRRGILAVRDSEADAKVMIVLSDGMPNNADRAENAAVAAAEEGIQVFAVGIGESFGAKQLHRLVAPSNGVVFEEKDAEKVVQAFSALLSRFDNFVATNGLIELTLAERVFPQRLQRTSPDNTVLDTPRPDRERKIRINVGNMERDKLYRFKARLKAPERGPGRFVLLNARLVYDIPSLGLKQQIRDLQLFVDYVGANDYGALDDAADTDPGTLEDSYPGTLESSTFADYAEDFAAARSPRRPMTIITDDGDDDYGRRRRPMSIPEQAPDSDEFDPRRPMSVITGDPDPPSERTKPGPPPMQPQAPPRFDVVLTDAGPHTILVAREMRDSTGAVLGQIKHVMRRGGPVKRNMERSAADALRERLEAVGARVEVREQRVPPGARSRRRRASAPSSKLH